MYCCCCCLWIFSRLQWFVVGSISIQTSHPSNKWLLLLLLLLLPLIHRVYYIVISNASVSVGLIFFLYYRSFCAADKQWRFESSKCASKLIQNVIVCVHSCLFDGTHKKWSEKRRTKRKKIAPNFFSLLVDFKTLVSLRAFLQWFRFFCWRLNLFRCFHSAFFFLFLVFSFIWLLFAVFGSVGASPRNDMHAIEFRAVLYRLYIEQALTTSARIWDAMLIFRV